MTTDVAATEAAISDVPAGPPSGDAEVGESTPTAGIVRDIARGGLAGLAVGIVLGGLGGRLVMRLAALLVPTATGFFTENGNQIGVITFGGSVANHAGAFTPLSLASALSGPNGPSGRFGF